MTTTPPLPGDDEAPAWAETGAGYGGRVPRLRDDGHRWISVTFRAQLPPGTAIYDVDTAEVAATLAKAFGFTAVEALTIAAVVHAQEGQQP